MANRHISVPISVANGDASEWLKRFDICSRANEWSNGTKALKLLTLLEGEALATWLELSEESLQDCKEKDDRENCADEIRNTRGISPASWWSIATVYPWPEETAGSSYAGRWCHRQGTTSSTSIPGRSTSSSEHKVVYDRHSALQCFNSLVTLCGSEYNGGKVDTSVGGELDCQNCEVRSTWKLRMAGETRLFISIDCSITFSPITLNS